MWAQTEQTPEMGADKKNRIPQDFFSDVIFAFFCRWIADAYGVVVILPKWTNSRIFFSGVSEAHYTLHKINHKHDIVQREKKT